MRQRGGSKMRMCKVDKQGIHNYDSREEAQGLRVNITCYKNLISVKRSARRQQMYVLRCIHAVLTWLTDP